MPKGRRRFSDEQVRAIRKWWRVLRETPSVAEMARRLGVCEDSVRQIADRRCYKDVEDSHAG